MKRFSSLGQLKEEAWYSSCPFSHYKFLHGLEVTQCIGENSGWTPEYFSTEKNDCFIYSYRKSHSYGEYIFDWGWADAYHRVGKEYYPKYTSMIPFTPVTVDHFIMEKFDEDLAGNLLSDFHDVFLKESEESSHFLFLKEREIPIFRKQDYLIRESFQYHFENKNYSCFSDFLACLKSRKVKQITKERVSLDGVEFKHFSGDEILREHGRQMYLFYLSTIRSRGAIPYLKEHFFEYIFEVLKNNIIYVQALSEGDPIAGSFFLFDDDRLYGRYWGANKYVKNLHFELCYYQGIEIVIKKKLKVFEAGAQGEHKLARGFIPKRTYSAHFMKGLEFHHAIGQFITQEKDHISQTIAHLNTYLPYALDRS